MTAGEDGKVMFLTCSRLSRELWQLWILGRQDHNFCIHRTLLMGWSQESIFLRENCVQLEQLTEFSHVCRQCNLQEFKRDLHWKSEETQPSQRCTLSFSFLSINMFHNLPCHSIVTVSRWNLQQLCMWSTQIWLVQNNEKGIHTTQQKLSTSPHYFLCFNYTQCFNHQEHSRWLLHIKAQRLI